MSQMCKFFIGRQEATKHGPASLQAACSSVWRAPGPGSPCRGGSCPSPSVPQTVGPREKSQQSETKIIPGSQIKLWL